MNVECLREVRMVGGKREGKGRIDIDGWMGEGGDGMMMMAGVD